FNATNGSPAGSTIFAANQSGDWAEDCIRWGADGFAVLGSDGTIYIIRWTAAGGGIIDSDGDGLADAWELANFGALDSNPGGDPDGDGLPNFLEYLFVTPPFQATASPVQVNTTNIAGATMLRLVFPRRAGLAQRYGFATSTDLVQWT